MNFKNITLDNLSSLYSTKEWIRENISAFKDKDISNKNMLIFFDYLRDNIFDSDLDNKNEWLKRIISLRERMSIDNE